jgi:hypothetical protein
MASGFPDYLVLASLSSIPISQRQPASRTHKIAIVRQSLAAANTSACAGMYGNWRDGLC